jgi:hypothetical protein
MIAIYAVPVFYLNVSSHNDIKVVELNLERLPCNMVYLIIYSYKQKHKSEIFVSILRNDQVMCFFYKLTGVLLISGVHQDIQTEEH